MTDVQFSPVDEDVLDTILGDDVDFNGTLVFKHPLMIRGRVGGRIDTTSDLYIDEKAIIEADIAAHDVSIRGRVQGNIKASGRVELHACCHVDGDITAEEVSMESGCFYRGACTMTGKKT
ncbi:MAG: polymer-forming cytoskeletal protein [Spirochaetes bacterium]|nr:polymer-forming cytoskeletal protein [Spirochaetota bacterium]MBU0956908.1 polymer-forming cytoskeletal protein [Spirochaetota bacterium]